MPAAAPPDRYRLLRLLAARRQQEVETVQLEALRRAGSAVPELALLADRLRDELRAAGQHPWEADPATASLFLSVWNAQVYQALGAELLDSDRREDPRTAGYVPVATYRQSWAFFSQVAPWLSAARRAAASDDVWVGDEVDLPVSLATVLHPVSTPVKHLKGLLTAGDVLDQLLEQQLGAVHAAGPVPERWTGALRRIDELAAQARASLHYAQGLWHPDVDGDLAAVVVGHLHPALVLEHHVGQFLALPELVLRYRSPHRLRRLRGPA